MFSKTVALLPVILLTEGDPWVRGSIPRGTKRPQQVAMSPAEAKGGAWWFRPMHRRAEQKIDRIAPRRSFLRAKREPGFKNGSEVVSGETMHREILR